MGDIYPKAKVAATAVSPIYWDREATTQKAVKYILEAGANGANIIGFPEGFIPGYPWWIWFGSPPWGMRFYKEFHENAVEIPSPTTNALCDAAEKANIYVVMGLTERKGATLYCSQLFINPQGNIMGVHRKLKATHVERSIWGDGGYLQVFDTEYGKLGALNCFEHLMPLTRYAMYYLGEQIHVSSWPAFSMKIGHAFTEAPAIYAARHMAAEGSVFVLLCSQLITKQVIEKICDTPEKLAMVEAGGAWAEIIAPDGHTIGSPISGNNEGILYADIDLEDIIYMKNACDTVGHYTRPDLLQLLFNRETPLPVKEVVSGKAIQTKELNLILSKYEILKKQIEKSGDNESKNIAVEFERELKSLME